MGWRIYTNTGALKTSGTGGVSGATDAADLTYTPTTSGDWDTPPDDAAEALDELAGRVETLENSGGGSVDASGVTYTPAVNTDWDSDTDPGNVDDALDQIAERVDDLEAAPPAHVHDASVITYTPAANTDWNGDTDPGDVDNALDQLAERVKDIETSGGGGGSALPQGYVNGFQVNVTGTDVTIKPGTCRSDDNTTDLTRTTSAGDITVDPDSTGANGLDTGSPANNTWYYVYVIWNGSTTAGLMSTSTSPTMPSGYTKKRRVGMVRTNGSAALFKQETITREARREVIYLEDVTAAPFLIMSNGAVSTSGTWDSKDASAIVPPTAREARMYFNSNTPSNAFTLNYRMNSSQIWRILGAQLNNEQYNLTATLPLTSSQTFEITQATGGTVTEDLSIQVHGYVDDLAVGYV